MNLTYKLTFPLDYIAKRIVDLLNTLGGVTATSEFVSEIPRHYLIHIKTDADLTPEELLNLGAIIGSQERV